MTQKKLLRYRATLRGTKRIISDLGNTSSSDDQEFGSDLKSMEYWVEKKLAGLAVEDMTQETVLSIYEASEVLVSQVRPANIPPPPTGPCGVCGAPNCKRHIQGYQLGKPGL